MSGVNPLDYLLGELPAAEMERGRRQEATDAAFRAELERLRPVVDALHALPDDAWDPPIPPPFATLGIGEPPAPAAPVRPPARRRWLPKLAGLQPAMGLAAAVALLVVGAIVGAAITGSDPSTSPVPAGRDVVLASLKSAPTPPRGDVSIASEARQIAVAVDDLAPNRDGNFYAVWLLNDDGTMVALGGFQVDPRGHAEIDVPIPVEAGDYRYVDISLEPGDGNPRHSGDSVLRGEIS